MKNVINLNKFKIICNNCKNEAYIQENYAYDGLGNSHATLTIICDYCKERKEEITEITYSTDY